MKITVEISQARSIGNSKWVPALVGLIIQQPTGTKGPNDGTPPDFSVFVDLTAKQARKLAKSLNQHAELVELVEVAEAEHAAS